MIQLTVFWINTNYEEDEAYHFRKTVEFNKDTIISETNIYYGQREYKFNESTIKEKLSIRYNFNQNLVWECTFLTGTIELDDGYYYIENINISKEQANEILESWGLQF